MSAWDAITVAQVARTTSGQRIQSGPMLNNGLSMASGSGEQQGALAEVVEHQRRETRR